MNLLSIAYKSIKQRALSSSLTSLSVALGVMLMVAVLVIHGIIDRMFSQQTIGYELIVGRKGSGLQLVLNTVYRLKQPIENLPYLYYLELKNDPRVQDAVPFALGDFTKEGGFPIIGTVSDYFVLDYAPDSRFKIRGTGFRESFDAIIGSRVAKTNGWDVGSTFTLVHNSAESTHEHDEVFTVRGVMQATGTPNDKTVFIHLNGFYAIAGHDRPLHETLTKLKAFYTEGIPGHPELDQMDPESLRPKESDGHDGHHHGMEDWQKEVTAVLINCKRPPDWPADAASPQLGAFQAEKKRGFQAQAVNPIEPMRELMQDIVGNIRKVLMVMTGLIIIVSGISIFVSIYNSMSDRRREIAIMRALGAQRRTVFSIILAESLLLCVGGGFFGVLMGHGLVFAAAPYVAAQSGLLIDPFAFEPIELTVLPALIVLASLVGIIPGLTAYRTDVAKALAE
jgi:putative ABC transport system permease protein